MLKEQLPDNLSLLSREQVDDLLQTVLAFIKERDLRFGVCMLLLDADGIKTVGNVPPDLQYEAMAEVCKRLSTDGPDTMEVIHEPAKH